MTRAGVVSTHARQASLLMSYAQTGGCGHSLVQDLVGHLQDIRTACESFQAIGLSIKAIEQDRVKMQTRDVIVLG